MTTTPVFSPRTRRAAGCCVAPVRPALEPEHASTLARKAKALADPTRLRIVDAVRTAAPEALCQCELLPLFEMTQPALAKHLRVLVDAEVLGAERRGTWMYYYARPGGLEELIAWLT